MPFATYPSRNFGRTLAVVLLLSAVLTAHPAPAAAAGDDRADALAINELVRAGRRAEALPLCRAYASGHPDDAVMLYNLACLENTVGDPDAAAAAYRGALLAGFDAWEAAEADPDHQGPLADVVRRANLAEAERLGRLVAAGRTRLSRDVWTPARRLVDHGVAAATDTAGVWLRFRWAAEALEFELTAGGDWADLFAGDDAPPWQGGPGLALSLGTAPDGDWLRVDDGRLFACGLDAKGAVGAVYLAPPGVWQPVAELAPKVRVDDGGRLQLTGRIPWSAIAPLDPLVDTPLGVNATLLRPGAGGLRRASLLPTNDTIAPEAATRRLVPLDFATDSVAGDALAGRMETTLSSVRPLDLDLVVISRNAGAGTLTLDFKDQAGRSVLPRGAVATPIELVAGTNRLRRQVDFSGLKTGGYLVEVGLGFPSGGEATWRTTVLQLAPGWDRVYREKIDLVGADEQPTVAYLLRAVEDAVAGHDPRANPGPIITTLIDLESMLAGAEENGTILPERGSFVVVYPGPDGEERLCHMYLPAGRAIADGINPILVLADGDMSGARLADRIRRNYEFGDRKPRLKTGRDDRFPIYLVPEFRPDPARFQADLLEEVRAVRAWAMTYFDVRALSLVGIDAAGGAVLRAARTAPVTLAGLMVFAGFDLEPWPQAQPAFLREQLGPAPENLPVTWIDFVGETRRAGQGADLLQALRDVGYDVTSTEVRGGLNLAQVADRVVIWAEDLR
ncbi:hypothetical protein KDM41_08315 [bacterium]|nr:hypothetical protein [bacterium]